MHMTKRLRMSAATGAAACVVLLVILFAAMALTSGGAPLASPGATPPALAGLMDMAPGR